MAGTLDNLQSILSQAISSAPLGDGFAKAMEAALVKGHTAAVLAAAAERAGVRPDSGLFKGLSKAERADIKRAVAEQLTYLRRFVATKGDMSEAQIRARAQLYAGSVRATYEQARHPGLPFYPGQGSECLTNCKCSWEQQSDGYHWTLHAAEHCPTCENRASGNPYQVGGSTAVKAQTPEERAMFANMGKAGTLRAKGPDGKRTGAAEPKAGSAAESEGDLQATDRALRRSGLITDKKMTTEEERSLHWYQSAGHDRINAELRGSAKVRDQYTLDMTTGNLDRVMERSKIKRDVTVHRGIFLETQHGEAEIAKWKPGTTFRDKGYVSTTINPDVARKFGGDQVEVRIHAKAGTPAIYMPTARPLSMTSRGSHNEHEVLLGRNLSYRVVSRNEKDGKTVIELETVPEGH